MTKTRDLRYHLSVAPQDAKWSGDYPIPKIGDRVFVRINEMGYGKVTEYFVEDGWLGIYAVLEKRPEWHIKQLGPSHNYTMVFGIETKPCK